MNPEVADNLLDFLLSDQKIHFLRGIAGTGKSTAICEVITKLLPKAIETQQLLLGKSLYSPSEPVVVAATTHVAVQSLKQHPDFPVHLFKSYLSSPKTVHYTFNIPISAGKLRLNTPRFYESLVIIDECTRLNKKEREHIEACLHETAKVLYVGDPAQLCQITGEYADWESIPSTQLTQIHRTASPHLRDLYQDLSKAAASHSKITIQTKAGIVDYFEPEQIEQFMIQNYESTHLVLAAFTHRKLHQLNEHMRKHFSLVPGKYLPTQKHYFSVLNGKPKASLDTFTISPPAHASIDGEYQCIYSDGASAQIPIFHTISEAPQDFYANRDESFQEVNIVLPTIFSTIHRLQGLSIDTVVIDLTDISKSPDALRMLYVAASRATARIIFFGKLNPKFGAIV